MPDLLVPTFRSVTWQAGYLAIRYGRPPALSPWLNLISLPGIPFTFDALALYFYPARLLISSENCQPLLVRKQSLIVFLENILYLLKEFSEQEILSPSNGIFCVRAMTCPFLVDKQFR